MAISSFADRLDSALGQVSGKTQSYLESFRTLRETAQELQTWLKGPSTNNDAPISVDVEPGFQSQMGQQLNVVVQIPNRGVRDTLFRAYVPAAGAPVNLDFYGEEPVPSGTPQEIQENVLNFLTQPEIVSRMNMYRELIKG